MSITVKNLDQYKLMDQLKKSECELCKQALNAIRAYEELQEINRQTQRKMLTKIKELSRK